MSDGHATDGRELASEIGPLIAQSRRMIWLAAAKRLEAEGQSMLSFQVLGQIVRSGPRTQRSLSDALAQHPAGICRLLDDMEQDGLVERARDQEDRRRVNVAITRRGRAHHAALLPSIRAVVENAIAPLSATERETLRDLLRKVVGAGTTAGAGTAAVEQKPARIAKRRTRKAAGASRA